MEIEYEGYTIKIEQEEYPVNPFEEWDFPESLTLYAEGDCVIGEELELYNEEVYEEWDKRYFKDNEHYYCFIATKDLQICVNCREKSTCKCLQEWRYDNELYWQERKRIFDIHQEYTYLPVYKYEHGGVAYSTIGFNDPWDSGCVGYIAIRNDDEVKDPEEYLKQIVNLFHCWASGSVYGWAVMKDDEVLDSCWGYYCEYGDDGWENMVATAKEAVEDYHKTVWGQRKQEVIDYNHVN